MNDRAIVLSDLENRFSSIQKVKNISGKKIAYEKSRLLDQFIEDELVAQSAQEASIIVSDRKVMSRIEGMLKSYLARSVTKEEELEKLMSRYSSDILALIEAEREFRKGPKIDPRLADFFDQIQKTQNQDFLDFFETARTQIRRQDLISISLGVSPPSDSEALDWFRDNRSKLGYEMWVKHILIIPRGKSFSAERDANKKLSALRKRILGGESFEKLAAQYSEDPGSASKGGDLGWIMPAELDPYFAGNVFNNYKYKSVSSVFKSGFGYHIVKYFGKRTVTFEKVRPMIMQRLYYEKISDQFKKWVARKKKESEIKIYMDTYVEG